MIACITGPSRNKVGAATTYVALTDFRMRVCAAVMVPGRLEFFAEFVLITASF